MALTALNHFKDLQHSPHIMNSPSALRHLHELGLPIFICDAVISAYARKPSLISQSDLDSYFTSTELFRPDFSKDVLDEILDRWLTVQPAGGAKEGGEENGIDNSGEGRSAATEENKGLNRDASLGDFYDSPSASKDDEQMSNDTGKEARREDKTRGEVQPPLGRMPMSRTTVDGIIDLEEMEKVEETVTHDSLSKCTTILCCWLGEVRPPSSPSFRISNFLADCAHRSSGSTRICEDLKSSVFFPDRV